MRHRTMRDDSGVIMVIVTVFVIVMSVVMVGILSRNSSQALSNIADIKRIHAEQVADGAYSRLHTLGHIPPDYNEVIDGVTYQVRYFDEGPTGPGGEAEIRVNVQY